MQEESSLYQDKHFIWTDNERTHFIIWSKYEGFVHHHDDYNMYKRIGRDNPICISGMIKYALSFYFEVSEYYDELANKRDCEELKKDKKDLDKLFMSENIKELQEEDYRKIREIFNRFMVKSGIKKIVQTKHDRPEITKPRV